MSQRVSARWARIASAVWLVLAAAVAALWAVVFAWRWPALHTVCHPQSACAQFQLDGSAAHTLSLHGISLTAYAITTALITALIFLFWYGLGALILWRKPDDRGALVAVFFLVVLPGVGINSWLSPSPPLDWILTSAFLMTLVLFGLLFPAGRFAPRWTRWLVVTLVLADVLTTVPLPGRLQPIQFVSFLAILAILLAVPGLQIYRYRAISSWSQRQQTKWVFFGLVVAILGFAAMYILPSFIAPSWVINGALYAAVTNGIGGGIVVSAVPVCIAIAVFRNRLWDIDHVINRALVYGVLTTTLAGIYVGSVIGLQALSRLVVGGTSPLTIAVSTLVIAALFGPLRRQIQNGIDRRFYRRKYDATRTLASFQIKLRDEVDLDRLTGEVISVVRETVQPASVSLWLIPGRSDERLEQRALRT